MARPRPPRRTTRAAAGAGVSQDANKPCTNEGGTNNCEHVSIAYSSSPAVPWEKHVPVLSAADPPGGGGRQSVIANPSPLVLANGSVMLVYRYNPPSRKPAGEVVAVAMAASWRGPYHLIADNLANINVTGDG